MKLVVSQRFRLGAVGCWLVILSVATGCSTSRWGFTNRDASVSHPVPAERSKNAIANLRSRKSASGKTSSQQKLAESELPDTTDSVDRSRQSERMTIRQIDASDERQSLADIVEANFSTAQSNGKSGRKQTSSTRLQIPKELPGAEAPTVDLPPHDTDDVEGRAKDIAKNFIALPIVPDGQVNTAGEGRSYTLEELQAVALASNPLMSQAEAEIINLRGTAMQAGLHPNPTIGYEADTVGSNGNPNYQGGFLAQKIKTAGKLGLAESVANVDVWNADLMRQKTRVVLITQVRGAYFAALIARENIKVTEALVRFTDSVYQIQLDQLRGGLVSVYEPIQLRALAVQARTALTQARNRYDSAWRQLAATIGSPDLPIGDLEGSADLAIPAINYDAALPYILSNHTDVIAARNSETQARVNLRLQEVTPFPDVDVYTALQKDFTTAPVYRMTYNLQVGIPVPIFDKNQGNILSAHGKLMKASNEAARVQNELAAQLADAVERYANTSNIVQMYREHVLPDQARAYRGVYERHQQQPDLVGFADVVNAQQTLLISIGTYINSLGARWQAFTQIGELIQAETLDEITGVVQSGDTRDDESYPLIPPIPSED